MAVVKKNIANNYVSTQSSSKIIIIIRTAFTWLSSLIAQAGVHFGKKQSEVSIDFDVFEVVSSIWR